MSKKIRSEFRVIDGTGDSRTDSFTSHSDDATLPYISNALRWLRGKKIEAERHNNLDEYHAAIRLVECWMENPWDTAPVPPAEVEVVTRKLHGRELQYVPSNPGYYVYTQWDVDGYPSWLLARHGRSWLSKQRHVGDHSPLRWPTLGAALDYCDSVGNGETVSDC